MNKVLIVDDSRMILTIAKDLIINNVDDLEVTTELDPRKAKELIDVGGFQVIILDIIMPEVSGIELLKWIRSNSKFDNINVIMFTSLNDTNALSECFGLGAYDFITKPLDENEFLARLRHAINEYEFKEILLNNYEEISNKKKRLEALNFTLKQTQSELIHSERLAGIGFLAAGMAHEINNPLGYINSNIATLQDNVEMLFVLYENVRQGLLSNPENERLIESIGIMEEEVSFDFIKEDSVDIFDDLKDGISRIETIINSLRNFSTIDPESTIEPINLGLVIEGILVLTKSKIEGRIEVEVNSNISTVLLGNKSDVNLSLLNIINNAFEAIEEKGPMATGHLWINGSENDEHIVLEFEDDGVGMPEEVMKHAYDPFYTTKDVGSGTGLGLSTAYNCFATVMKGEMKISSYVGKGTKIIIIIPKRKEV